MTSRPSSVASAAKPMSRTNAPRMRIWAVVSWRRRSVADSGRSRSAPAMTIADRDDDERERAEQDQRRGRAARVAREEQREQDDRREVGDRRARDDELSEGRPRLAAVLEHRDDDSQRRRAQRDRDEHDVVDDPDRLQARADDERDREAHREARARDAQRPPAQLVEVDLQAGEEEQERQADDRQHGHRLVDLDPAEHGRPDDDPEDDLQHDGRQPQRRRQPEEKRRGERHRADDQEVGEPELHRLIGARGWRSSPCSRRPTRPGRCRAPGSRPRP